MARTGSVVLIHALEEPNTLPVMTGSVFGTPGRSWYNASHSSRAADHGAELPADANTASPHRYCAGRPIMTRIGGRRVARSPGTAFESPTLTESSRAVLRVLALHGPVTRPRLGVMLDLSKPTMSAAVTELGALGLVTAHGVEKGGIGRTAMVYGLGPAAGYVIGVDVGAAQVRAVAHSLDGRALASAELRIEPQPGATAARIGDVVLASAQQIIRAVGGKHGILRSVAVAVPRIVSEHRLGSDPVNGPEVPLGPLRARIAAPILLENNVNCAAIGEMSYGAAQGRGTFAYLQVGVRIGLGIISEGRLYRGAGGAAGEVGRLPFPWSSTAMPKREELEHYLGAHAFTARCAASWPVGHGAPPVSAKELFAMAEMGSRPARDCVFRHAGDIGRLVAACIGMLDPGLVVLGGGVGQNPLAIDEIRRVATDLTWPTQIAVSPLADGGTVLGAMKLAADYGLGLLLQDERHPAVVLPPLPRKGGRAMAS